MPKITTDLPSHNLHLVGASAELQNGGPALAFQVVCLKQVHRAFVIRHQGGVYGYINQCTHVPIELDWTPNHFWDSTQQFLVCATHGAMYSPTTGQCFSGPCRSGLKPIAVCENGGSVYWQSTPTEQPFSDSTDPP
jgi:nitrite reductase/ring-hydroxylating ferredoxin subunit